MFRRFHLDRRLDVSGVSGTGIVAQGVEFGNGKCAVTFINGPVKSVIAYDSIEDVEAVHCHGGATKIFFVGEIAKANADVQHLRAIADSHAKGKEEGVKEAIEFLKMAGFDSTEPEIDKFIRMFKEFLVKALNSKFIEGGPEGYLESGRAWINL